MKRDQMKRGKKEKEEQTAEAQTLSIIGLSKNAGKTTVLGALIRSLSPRGPLGLASIGVDGEERDAWSGREKPPIEVPEGGWVATAGLYLNRNPGQWEIAAHTGLSSTAGDIYLARAKRSGRTVLAGVTTKEGMERVLRFMREAGCRHIFVDGAYDRKTTSSPFLTDRMILVVGASLGQSLDVICQRFEESYRLFGLPASKDQKGRKAAEWAMQKRKIVGLKGGEPILFPFASLWEWEREDRKVPCETIALPGALTDRGLTILSHQKGLERLIVPDATHLFVSLSALRRFQATGVQVEVLRPTSIAAVAVNPVSPDGYSFPPDEMKARIQAICPTVPVWDAIRDHPGEGGCFDVLG